MNLTFETGNEQIILSVDPSDNLAEYKQLIAV